MAGRRMLSHGVAIDAHLDNAGELITGQMLGILCWQLNAGKHSVVQGGGQQLVALLLHLSQELSLIHI